MVVPQRQRRPRVSPQAKVVAPTSAAPAAAQAEKTLANTGVRVIEIVGAALAVLVLGVVLLVVRSRRAR